MRKSVASAKSSLSTALVLLLKANGYLGLAASHSRQLKKECPKLWKLLRYKFGGIDMLTFLIRDPVQEYIDRISILEREPITFLKMMEALIKAGKTKEIFLPA